MTDTSPPSTDDVVDDRVLPPASELKRLLELYFEEPITDEIADRLHRTMVEMRADRPRLNGEVSAYNGNRARCEGKAWYEDFSSQARLLRDADVALFHASTTRGWPKAKPYCPEYFVGTWTQTDESGDELTWTFAASGAFETTQRDFARFREWHVKRHERPGNRFPHALLSFREGEYYSWRDHTIVGATDGAFAVQENEMGVDDHRLVRATRNQEGPNPAHDRPS